MLEPASVAEMYELVQAAFDLSERVGTPVFVRSVTAVASSHAPLRFADPLPPPERKPILEWDIAKYTKAGAAICMQQHRDLIARLDQAGQVIREMKLNRLELGGALGIIAAGVTAAYLDEGFEILERNRVFEKNLVSVLQIRATHPFPADEVHALLEHCDTILVLEELEPHIERSVYVEAQRRGSPWEGRIVGKLDGTFERIGEYDVRHMVRGVEAALELEETGFLRKNPVSQAAEMLVAARPITVCAGCPHRGTYMAVNQAIRKLKLKRDQVMVTGDIGCTILGMNPPFNTVWNEVSMGASISLAQGYAHSGLQPPVIAAIGDSTFFHGGIPGLINAVQHQVPLTLIILDNGWTAMTGMQVNPGTAERFQPQGQRIDIAKIIPALGVEHFFEIDPFDLRASTETLRQCLTLPGVKVVLSHQECAIQAMRYGLEAGHVRVVAENCNLCNLCIMQTGCPAIDVGEDTIVIDPGLCYGCGLCAQVCQRDAIEIEIRD